MSFDDTQAEVPLTSIRVDIPRQRHYSADKICCAAYKIRKYFMTNILLIMTLGGVLIGLAVGLSVRTIKPSRDVLMWIGMPGELFLRLLKLMILPLIVCSVVSGTANLDPRSNGKISLVAFIFIVATNILACAMAIALSVAIHPGRPGVHVAEKTTDSFMQTQDIFADLLRNLAPDNIVEACFKQALTQYSTDTEYIERNTTNATYTEMIVTGIRTVGKTDGVNVLGLIVVCGVIGIAANVSKEKGKAFLDFFSSATDVVLIVLRWFMWMGPIGISSLIAVAMASIQDIEETFSRLGMFMVTVTVGIVLHQIVVMPIIFFAITRRNPFAFIVSIFRAWLLAFATTSTAVAIPEMIAGCEKQKVDPRIARVVIPFCVTINADGSALYITSAAIFIAQSLGTPVSAGDLVTIGILTAIAAMAIPSVPSASIVTLVIILTSLNIPADDIALLFAVEWYLDRIRTTSNVISHTFTAAITHHFCKGNLRNVNASQDKKPEISEVWSPIVKNITSRITSL